MTNEEVTHIAKKKETSYIKQSKANWIGHIWCRNRLLRNIVEGNIKGKRRQGRRRKQLLDDLKEKIILCNR
jgi:hypothetical protein